MQVWRERGEERLVGGMGGFNARTVQAWKGPSREQQEERSRLRSGLREFRSAPMEDTERPEGQGNTRRGWCPKGNGTDSCKEEGSSWSGSGKANRDGTEKGLLASATWGPLGGLGRH